VTRLRWGGSLLEEAASTPTRAADRAPHAVAAEAGAGAGRGRDVHSALTEADLRRPRSGRSRRAAGGVSLAEAKVVVSGGRGVGSPEGFAIIEELAACSAGASAARAR
jgi:electron transfer flavoprotein alpha subunit